MPIKIIGMIGVAPPSSKASLHVIEGGLSPFYLTEFARAHDRAGFDMVLVGYSSSSAEGFLVALDGGNVDGSTRLSHCASARLAATILLARKIATFDHLTGGSRVHTSSPASPMASRMAMAISARRTSAIDGRRNIWN